MKKILIVEDELIVRSIYRRKFEISGFQVETAEEGSAALTLMGSFKPDAVQVDLGLPGMDGVEVIKQIRTWPEFKSTPILVISSFYRPDLAADAWKAGATKCVSKMDCTPNLALELIEQMLSGDKSPFAKFGEVAMFEGNDGIRVLPAESPWEEATQIFVKKPKPAAGAPPPTAAPVQLNTAVPKQPTTLPKFAHEKNVVVAAPNFAKSEPAPSAPKPAGSVTLPNFAKQESSPTIPNFAKPDAGKSEPAKADAEATETPPANPYTPHPLFRPPPSAPKLSKPAATEPSGTGAVPVAPASGTVVPGAADDDPWPDDPNDLKGHPLTEGTTANAAFHVEIRQEFLKRAPQIQVELRDRVGALMKSKSTTDQLALLRDLEVSVSSLASLSGITGFSRISHLSGALDALIKDLHKKPAQMTNSVLRTIAHSSDCLNMLFGDLERAPRDVPQSTLILVVDDEPIARRTISVALAKSNLRCIGIEDSKAALAILKENPFDLIFLDAEMPGLNGFELCGELRKLPTNKNTPVIFVTSLTKFEVRAQSSLAGANDLIAKPFLMMELAVKALTYLLKPQPIVDAKAH